MGKYTGWFLVEVEHAVSHLPEHQRREIQDELSDHLDAAIQARLELGEAPELAELNAVRALGMPAAFAPSFGAGDQSKADLRLLGAASACCLAYVFGTAFMLHPLFPAFAIAFLVSLFGLLRRVKLNRIPSRQTVLWSSALVLAILSIGLPLARVSPPNDDSLAFPAASLEIGAGRLNQEYKDDLANMFANTNNQAVWQFHAGRLEAVGEKMGELRAVRSMSVISRLQRGFVQDLPYAEAGTCVFLLALLAPRLKSRRPRRSALSRVTP